MTADKTIWIDEKSHQYDTYGPGDGMIPYIPASQLTELQTKLDTAIKALKYYQMKECWCGNYLGNKPEEWDLCVPCEALDKIKGIK